MLIRFRSSRRTSLSALTVFALLAMPVSLSAQDMKGDAQAGRDYAATWCTGCHAIDRATPPSQKVGPDFSTIAQRRSTTASRLIRFLYSKHRNMPDFEIELDDATDIAAHIMSLKR